MTGGGRFKHQHEGIWLYIGIEKNSHTIHNTYRSAIKLREGRRSRMDKMGSGMSPQVTPLCLERVANTGPAGEDNSPGWKYL